MIKRIGSLILRPFRWFIGLFKREKDDMAIYVNGSTDDLESVNIDGTDIETVYVDGTEVWSAGINLVAQTIAYVNGSFSNDYTGYDDGSIYTAAGSVSNSVPAGMPPSITALVDMVDYYTAVTGVTSATGCEFILNHDNTGAWTVGNLFSSLTLTGVFSDSGGSLVSRTFTNDASTFNSRIKTATNVLYRYQNSGGGALNPAYQRWKFIDGNTYKLRFNF